MNTQQKRSPILILFFTALALMLAGLSICAAGEGERVRAPRIILRSLDRNVADVDWSPDGQWISYTKAVNKDAYREIVFTKPTGGSPRSLTASWKDRAGFPQKHVGCSTWHALNQYLVFSAENNDVQGRRLDQLAIPGCGLNCNLWATTVKGDKVWQLTFHETSTRKARGVLHPQLSKDGKKLFWAEPVGRYPNHPDRAPKGFAWGEWRLGLADFVVDAGTPALKNVKYMQPGEQPCFYETHGFSPDGRKALFCGNLKKGQPVNGMDIYALDVASGRVERLTQTFDDWDEHAHYAPDGKRIAWMSGAGLNVHFGSLRAPDWHQYVTTDLWFMNRDGSEPRRVTFFNQPGHVHREWFHQRIYKTPRVVIADSAWSPDGTQIAVNVAFAGPKDAVGTFLMLMDVAALEKGAAKP